ncbi:membrane lipoprotein lipid attachment site-containing protein [Aggregatibacter actinomycetemcomitans]|uniref:membrane lipoprotein lipid attachment site-containing protein n=1 Tax=Aggregatibacter actinomycetemcomitans TaxID=714 RepID=UPI001E6494DA|nr:membrane lipoprotein lipid attachment site-containing protein [Aggregatibacter actinomycetemcomitans]
MKKYISLLLITLGLAGCAELNSFNDAVGDIAGKFNQAIGRNTAQRNVYTQQNTTYAIKSDDSIESAANIDTLYIKIKRAFGFKTREEVLGSSWGKQRDWVESTLDERGFIHDKTPGVYYRLADEFEYGYLNVSLEKEGNKVRISWLVKSNNNSIAPAVKNKMLKAVK